MFMRLLVWLLVLFPASAQAKGLVPCGGPGEPPCQWCHVSALTHNVLYDFLLPVITIAAVLVIAVAGIRLVTSAGNQSAMTQAKSTITNLLIGYVIVLAAYAIINTIYSAFIPANGMRVEQGLWGTIACVAQPGLTEGRPSASPENRQELGVTDIADRIATVQAQGEVDGLVIAAANNADIPPEYLNTYRALVMQESSYCANKEGPPTQYGQALGCGQLLLSTAQSIRPGVTREQLLNDNALNLEISAQYFQSLLTQNNNDITRALASYNGGPGAVRPSVNCANKLRYQCEWDGADCRDGVGSSCQRNTGYQETRNYVANITRVAEGLAADTTP